MESQQDSPAITKSTNAINGKGLILLLVVFFVFKLLEQLTIARYAAVASDLTPDNILRAVNEQRSLRNLILLNTDTRLTNAAAYKSQDMITRKYFAHVDPDGNYIWPKIVAEGYSPYLQLGENLAIEFYDTESLVAAWMNSPTHRANVLQENFRDQGMGLNFGNSASGEYHTSIANTFGTLVTAKIPAIPASPASPTAATKLSQKPKPVKPKVTPPVINPAPTVVEKPVPSLSPSTTATVVTQAPATSTLVGENPVVKNLPLRPRENFAVLSQNFKAPANTTTPPLQPNNDFPIPLPSQNPEDNIKPYEITHYFTLAFGMILLLFLASDIKKVAQAKLQSIDKKMSNLALLFISLIVIAFMYWL